MRIHEHRQNKYFWVIANNIEDLKQSICATVSIGSSVLTDNSKTHDWMEWNLNNGEFEVNQKMEAKCRSYKEPAKPGDTKSFSF